MAENCGKSVAIAKDFRLPEAAPDGGFRER
jgi:hypothetical protein